jgi:hypothetical protein
MFWRKTPSLPQHLLANFARFVGAMAVNSARLHFLVAWSAQRFAAFLYSALRYVFFTVPLVAPFARNAVSVPNRVTIKGAREWRAIFIVAHGEEEKAAIGRLLFFFFPFPKSFPIKVFFLERGKKTATREQTKECEMSAPIPSTKKDRTRHARALRSVLESVPFCDREGLLIRLLDIEKNRANEYDVMVEESKRTIAGRPAHVYGCVNCGDQMPLEEAKRCDWNRKMVCSKCFDDVRCDCECDCKDREEDGDMSESIHLDDDDMSGPEADEEEEDEQDPYEPCEACEEEEENDPGDEQEANEEEEEEENDPGDEQEADEDEDEEEEDIHPLPPHNDPIWKRYCDDRIEMREGAMLRAADLRADFERWIWIRCSIRIRVNKNNGSFVKKIREIIKCEAERTTHHSSHGTCIVGAALRSSAFF